MPVKRVFQEPKKVFLWICQGILSLIFIYAAIPKLLDPQSFAEAISNYQMEVDIFVPYLALILPSLELVTGVTVLHPKTRQTSALLMLLMLFAFTIAIAQAMFRDIDISCGCFGKDNSPSLGILPLLRNIALMLASFYVLKTKK